MRIVSRHSFCRTQARTCARTRFPPKEAECYLRISEGSPLARGLRCLHLPLRLSAPSFAFKSGPQQNFKSPLFKFNDWPFYGRR